MQHHELHIDEAQPDLADTFFPPPTVGDVSEAERSAAATGFSNLVTDAMLNHAGAVGSYRTLGGYDRSYLTVGGHHYSEHHGSLPVYVEFAVNGSADDETLGDEHCLSEVLVERGGAALEDSYAVSLDPRTDDTHMTIFRLFKNGTMTRTEVPWGYEQSAQISDQAAALAGLPVEDGAAHLDREIASADEARQMEQDMGFNHTAVSAQEVGALADLLNGTELVPVIRLNPHVIPPGVR